MVDAGLTTHRTRAKTAWGTEIKWLYEWLTHFEQRTHREPELLLVGDRDRVGL